MTPTDDEKAAERYSETLPTGHLATSRYEAYLAGLAEGRKREREEILALLRSEPAISMMDKFSREWADWLSERLREGK